MGCHCLCGVVVDSIYDRGRVESKHMRLPLALRNHLKDHRKLKPWRTPE